MKINLKKLNYQVNTLDMVIDDLEHKRFVGMTGATLNDLKAALKLMTEIEKDLKLGGESIVELDKSRSTAIREAYGTES